MSTILSGSIARPASASFSSNKEFRKYVSAVTTSVTIGRTSDTSVKRVLYEVGPRYNSLSVALAVTPDNVDCIATAYDTSTVMSELFMSLAKKWTNFSATFARANLAGVVERIAKGLAADTAFKAGCTARQLAGGAPVRAHALATYTSPVGASQETVFIPRILDDVLTPDVFSILVFAVAGEGGTVATDMLEIDGSSREIRVRDVVDYAFAPAAVDALRVLGANMEACGAGDLFALAVTRGLHSVLSVVGHSDEGAFMRDVLRAGAFGVPFGSIHYGLREYAGLPALATSSGETVAGYVDGILLSTAAAVAHADPGIDYNGSWFPTILCGLSANAPEIHPGDQQDGNSSMAASNLSALVRISGGFSEIYIKALLKLFGLTTNTGNAARHLSASFGMISEDCRHLRHASVAPYYWIEPTSILPRDFIGSRAESEGFASKCGRNDEHVTPAWEDIALAGPPDSCVSNYVVRFRGARAAPFLDHFHGHKLNGVGHVVVKQLDPAGVIHPGPHERHTTVMDRVLANQPLSNFLWRRGQSPFCAPGEFLNLGETMGIVVHHMTISALGDVELNHVPSYSEFSRATVTYAAGAPVGIKSGALTEQPSMARRARTLAARALDRAVARLTAYDGITVSAMPTLLSAPPALRGRVAHVDVGPEPTQLRKSTARVHEFEGANDPNLGRMVEGTVPVATVVHSAAVSGPQLNPQAAAQSHRSGGGVRPSDPTPDASALGRTGVLLDDAPDRTMPVQRPTPTSEGAAPAERADAQ